MQRVVLELKIRRKSCRPRPEQTAAYAATCGADEAHVILFDRDGDKEWDDRIWERMETGNGRAIQVWGM